MVVKVLAKSAFVEKPLFYKTTTTTTTTTKNKTNKNSEQFSVFPISSNKTQSPQVSHSYFHGYHDHSTRCKNSGQIYSENAVVMNLS